jgi:hypothetical protein
MSQTTTTTDQPTRIVVHVDLDSNIPVICQLYGHSWQKTTQTGIKVCALCRLWGYCPGCTPIAPPNAQPFYCSVHAGHMRGESNGQ